MSHKHELDDFYIALLRTFGKFKILDSKPRDYGVGYKLYSSEIHTIEFVGRYPGSNITELSDKMGITKGAVSQTVNKLVKKKFVEKFRDPGNDKEVYVRLTEKGEKARKGHEDFHKIDESELEKYLLSLDKERLDFIVDLFDRMSDEIDVLLSMED